MVQITHEPLHFQGSQLADLCIQPCCQETALIFPPLIFGACLSAASSLPVSRGQQEELL